MSNARPCSSSKLPRRFGHAATDRHAYPPTEIEAAARNPLAGFIGDAVGGRLGRGYRRGRMTRSRARRVPDAAAAEPAHDRAAPSNATPRRRARPRRPTPQGDPRKHATRADELLSKRGRLYVGEELSMVDTTTAGLAGTAAARFSARRDGSVGRGGGPGAAQACTDRRGALPNIWTVASTSSPKSPSCTG